MNRKFLGGLLLAAALIHLPAFLHPVANTHSAVYNFLWTTQFADAFADGDFYPRWFPDSFEGLGSPTFYFYPPLTFWVSGAWAAIGLDPMLAVAITGALFGAGSGLAMYAWLAPRTPYAHWWSIVYMVAPYHMYDFYVRGALAEYAAFVWPPLILLAIDGLPSRRRVALLALAYCSLLLTHLPSALLVTVFVIAPYAAYQAWRRRDTIAPGLAGAALGVGLASFYLLPALSLQGSISTDELWSSYYQPSSWFLWNQDDPDYLLGRAVLALALLICGASARNIWGFIASIAAAAAVGLLPLIWEVPLLAQVQFPWRLLACAEFAVITAVALGPRRELLLKCGLALVVVPSSVFVLAAVQTFRTPVDFGEFSRTRPDAPEYLPAGLEVRGVTAIQRTPDLAAYRSLPRGRRIEIDAPARVTLGHADFPIWQVVHKGQVVPHSGPLITFDAPAGGLYTVERKRLPVETWGWIVSALAAFVLLILRFDVWSRLRPGGRSQDPANSPPT